MLSWRSLKGLTALALLPWHWLELWSQLLANNRCAPGFGHHHLASKSCALGFNKLSPKRRPHLKCSAEVACAILLQWLLLPGVPRVWLVLLLLPDVPNTSADVHPRSSPVPVVGQQRVGWSVLKARMQVGLGVTRCVACPQLIFPLFPSPKAGR